MELVNAILHVLKNGCLWRDVSGEFPPWGTVYWYFSEWQENGMLDELNARLGIDYRENAQKSAA